MYIRTNTQQTKILTTAITTAMTTKRLIVATQQSTMIQTRNDEITKGNFPYDVSQTVFNMTFRFLAKEG